MAKIRINGDTSGYIEISAPAVAGSTSITLPATTGGNFLVTDSSGNLNVDSGTLYVDATNNRVGIGTTSPGSALTVRGGAGIIRAEYLSNTAQFTTLNYDGAQVNGAQDAYWTVGSSQAHIWYTGATEAARIDSSRRLLVGTATATANGGVIQTSNGITFPATQSACSDANTLDDYEEGDWTPRIRDSSNNAATAAAANSGSYTKVGNRVFLTGRVQTSSVVGLTGASTAFITGLPFTIESGNKGRSGLTVGYANNLATGGAYAVTGYGENGDTRISLTKFDSTVGISALTINQWSDDGDILFSFSYQVN